MTPVQNISYPIYEKDYKEQDCCKAHLINPWIPIYFTFRGILPKKGLNILKMRIFTQYNITMYHFGFAIFNEDPYLFVIDIFNIDTI